MLACPANSDPRADRPLGPGYSGAQLEHRELEREPIVIAGDAQRLAQSPRPRAEQPLILDPAPSTHGHHAIGGLQRPNQDGAGVSFGLADEIEAPVDAVGAI